MTNSSIFKKSLALVLCLLMLAGTFTACMPQVEFNPPMGEVTTDGEATTQPSATQPSTTKPNNDTTTGDSATNDPEEDPVDPNELYSGSTTLENDSLIYGTLANDVFIGDESVTAMIPADVKVEAGASALELSIKNVEEATAVDGEALSNLDVHISGIALDNTVPMTVMLGAILPVGLANTELKLYHVENGTPVLMTRVNSASDFAIHNQYVYDAETGVVTIYVASFSVFTAVQTSADEWDGKAVADGFASGTGTEEDPFIIETAAQLVYFRNQVDAGVTFDDQFVKLTKDIDLADKPFDPIGFGYYNAETNTRVFMGTFDGGNHTVYNLYQNCWELDPDKTNYSTYTYSTAGAGLFASIKDAAIKNLAISGAEIVFECVDMGVLVGYAQGECHFENIVITDANIANYNRYTGGLVGEVSYGPYGIDTTKGYSHTFKNITIDSSVTVSGLWGSFGCGMGGVIGGKWGDATVHMENVVSAPVMDVYNDVVSAYQWYAFRGCGMLIGHTEEPYSDGRHSGNATASFLTCKNVNVYYGDWVDYTYYQFANQTDTEGNTLWYSNYPWVRAEAGEYCDAFSNIRYGIPLINGVKVTELSEEEFNAVVTSSTKITFDQLYGADRGMYGTNKHTGVNISYSSPKTFYIENNLGWTNLKLHYIYNHGEETWTTIPDGIELFESNGVYRIDLPVGATSFTITADGGFETETFIVSELTEKDTYLVHTHNFEEDHCSCGASQTETWELVTDISQIKNDSIIVFVYEEGTVKYEMSSIENNIGKYTAYTNTPAGLMEFEVVAGNNGLAFKNDSDYLSAINENKVSTSTSIAEDSSWTIEIIDGKAIVTNVSFTERVLQFNANSGSERFCCYKGTQKSISIYVKTFKISCAECVMETVEHKDASCGVAGYTIEKCSLCGKGKITEHEALEHTPSNENKYICANGCGQALNLPDAGSEISISDAKLIAETSTPNKYIITGTINSTLSGTYGATDIIDDNGDTIHITIIKSADGSKNYGEFLTKHQKGDTITISAKISKSADGVPQLIDAWLASHTDATTDTDHNCDVCGAENVTEHVDSDGDTVCDNGCGETISGSTEPDPDTPAEPTWTLVTDVATLQSGDQIIIVAKDYNYALSTTQNGNNRGQASVIKNGNAITFGDDVQVITLEEGTVDGTFAFNTGSGYLHAASSSSNYLRTEVKLSDNSSWTIEISDDGTATIVSKGTYTRNTMQYNQSSSLFACYASASQKAIVIYKLEGGSNVCEHTNTTTNTTPATCIKAGSITVTCDDCKTIISTEEIEALGHTTDNGTCERCGNEIGGSSEPTTTTETLSIWGSTGALADDSLSISWTSGDVTVTNNKSTSSTAIRTSDSDHYRIYKSSEVVIAVAIGNIKTVVITCTSDSYATELAGSLSTTGATAATDGSTVTVTIDSETALQNISFTLTAQSRINKVEVTYTK